MSIYRVAVEVHALERLADYWLEAEQEPRGPVVVAHSRGAQLGWIRSVQPAQGKPFPACRAADPADLRLHHQRKLLAAEVAERARQWASVEAPAMRIEDAAQTLDGELLVVYFSAPGRVDFRPLVRVLAQHYRKKLELYQLSERQRPQRDGAAQGRCGLECCCSAWLQEFPSVSVRMAEDQGLSLQPAAITGVCGRLLCCLRYEYDQLLAARQNPQPGDWVETPEGPARVLSVDPHNGTLEVEHENLEISTIPIGRARISEICRSCRKGTDEPAE